MFAAVVYLRMVEMRRCRRRDQKKQRATAARREAAVLAPPSAVLPPTPPPSRVPGAPPLRRPCSGGRSALAATPNADDAGQYVTRSQPTPACMSHALARLTDKFVRSAGSSSCSSWDAWNLMH